MVRSGEQVPQLDRLQDVTGRDQAAAVTAETRGVAREQHDPLRAPPQETLPGARATGPCAGGRRSRASPPRRPGPRGTPRPAPRSPWPPAGSAAAAAAAGPDASTTVTSAAPPCRAAAARKPTPPYRSTTRAGPSARTISLTLAKSPGTRCRFPWKNTPTGTRSGSGRLHHDPGGAPAPRRDRAAVAERVEARELAHRRLRRRVRPATRRPPSPRPGPRSTPPRRRASPAAAQRAGDIREASGAGAATPRGTVRSRPQRGSAGPRKPRTCRAESQCSRARSRHAISDSPHRCRLHRVGEGRRRVPQRADRDLAQRLRRRCAAHVSEVAAAARSGHRARSRVPPRARDQDLPRAGLHDPRPLALDLGVHDLARERVGHEPHFAAAPGDAAAAAAEAGDLNAHRRRAPGAARRRAGAPP